MSDYFERLQRDIGDAVARGVHRPWYIRAGQLIEQGVIGRVVQVAGLGPHRSSPASRPAWFWSQEKTGGILADIGSHHFEQFLHWSGAKSAKVLDESRTISNSTRAGARFCMISAPAK